MVEQVNDMINDIETFTIGQSIPEETKCDSDADEADDPRSLTHQDAKWWQCMVGCRSHRQQKKLVGWLEEKAGHVLLSF